MQPRHAERRRLEEEENQRLAELERQRVELVDKLLAADEERCEAERFVEYSCMHSGSDACIILAC